MSTSPILPQHGTHAEVVITSVEWLFEPLWSGDRLLAQLSDGVVSLTDEAGNPAGPEFADAARELLAAIDADSAVVDGVWTGQPFVKEGPDARERAATETRRAFVAFDLIELDGQSLLNIPFGERRRLLGSVVEENVRVRISPAVRLPLDAWLVAWRNSGFTHYIAKHENSRYRPGERTDQWLVVSAKQEPYPGLPARLLGQRPKKVRRIGD